MNEIKQWTLGITVSAIVGAIILFISPEGSTEKLVRTAVSLFLMCAILSPFITNADPMDIFNSLELTETQSAAQAGNEVAEYLQNELKGKILDILKDYPYTITTYVICVHHTIFCFTYLDQSLYP